MWYPFWFTNLENLKASGILNFKLGKNSIIQIELLIESHIEPGAFGVAYIAK